MEDAATCRNCGYQLKPIYKYCPDCGQKTQDDLTLRILFNNTISNYFSVDARFFKSFIPLIFKPGFLARKFVEGKRLTYLHPAQLYLFISVVFFFIFSFKVRELNAKADEAFKKGFKLEKTIQIEDDRDSVTTAIMDSADVAKITEPLLNNPGIVKGMSEEDRKLLDSALTSNLTKPPKNAFNFGYDSKKLDSLIAIDAPEKDKLAVFGINEGSGFFSKAFGRQFLKFHERQGSGIVQAISDTMPIAIFFLLPIFALILKIFYWRRGRFSHHLVFSFYFFSFLFMIMAILLGINQFLWEIPGWLITLTVFYVFIYFWLSARHFYEQGYILSFFKTGTIAFIYLVFNLVVSFGLILAASFMFY